MLTKFTEHPATVGETYWQHMGMALSFSGRMAVGAFVALVHAFLPFLFVKTGSQIITNLHQCMVAQRNRQNPAPKALSPHLARQSN